MVRFPKVVAWSDSESRESCEAEVVGADGLGSKQGSCKQKMEM